jgi:4-amino-4-deoxy-L-arabinose transferase-like glycosyltransferase
VKLKNLPIVILFLAAALLRFADAFRPIDQASWRECDMGAVARNFVREGMNPLYPRIDWRGDSPGFAEMELPVLPWLMAVTYKFVGIHDHVGRMWACLFSLGTLFFFFRLARQYLDLAASTTAFAFFAFNPLVVDLSTAVQPEGVMICCYVAAAYFFVRWMRSQSSSDFIAAAALTALTLLTKATSAHIGLFFGVLLLQKFGWSIFRQATVWIFGVISLVPAALWYMHAKGLWRTYGNSLGVSNEYHWIGPDFLTNSYFIKGILQNELVHVWVVFGVLIALFALWRGHKEAVAKHSIFWLASAFVFYIAASRTAADDWAYYYHIFSIPAAALLVGLGAKCLIDAASKLRSTYRRDRASAGLAQLATVGVVAAITASTFLLEAKQLRANLLDKHLEVPAYKFAGDLRPILTADGPIVASGGHCVDGDGYQVAYNASYMFYWLDRKGWNVCVEEQSRARLGELASKGAVYFIAEKKYLAANSSAESETRAAFPAITENADFIVFDLTRRPH